MTSHDWDESAPTAGEAQAAVLAACPFCGGECAVGTETHSRSSVEAQGLSQAVFFFVNCIRCGSTNKGIIGHTHKSKAIAAWNTRAPLAPAAVERAGEVLQQFEDALSQVEQKQIDEFNPQFNMDCTETWYCAPDVHSLIHRMREAARGGE